MEERLARALDFGKMAGEALVKDALRRAGLALYDPATHEVIRKVTREELEFWIASAYIERSSEVADVADYVLNKLRGGTDG